MVFVCKWEDCRIKQDFANSVVCVGVRHVKLVEYGGDEFDEKN